MERDRGSWIAAWAVVAGLGGTALVGLGLAQTDHDMPWLAYVGGAAVMFCGLYFVFSPLFHWWPWRREKSPAPQPDAPDISGESERITKLREEIRAIKKATEEELADFPPQSTADWADDVPTHREPPDRPKSISAGTMINAINILDELIGLGMVFQGSAPSATPVVQCPRPTEEFIERVMQWRDRGLRTLEPWPDYWGLLNDGYPRSEGAWGFPIWHALSIEHATNVMGGARNAIKRTMGT